MSEVSSGYNSNFQISPRDTQKRKQSGIKSKSLHRSNSRHQSRSLQYPSSRHQNESLYRPQDLDTQHRQHLRLQVITNNKGYVELDISNRGLKYVPYDVFYFTRLEMLNISSNLLKELPGSICRIRSLKVLHIQENLLPSLPETLTNCTHLTELNLTRNKISSLPRNIGALRNMKILKLGQNQFKSIPHDVGLLTNLRYIDLHGNKLWYLPFSIQHLHRVKYLNLANNRFEHIPLPICQITTLSSLNLRGNSLENLVPDFEQLRNLTELDISYNRFERVPAAISKLNDLRYLNVSGNVLKHIGRHMSGLIKLKVLHAHDNEITSFHDCFPNLQYINLANNKLYNFSIVNLSKLKYLNANNNFIENLPNGISTLQRLETVRLNNNTIAYISEDLFNLKQLRCLDLGNNRLVSIPDGVQNLNRLDYFNIKGNNLNHNNYRYESRYKPGQISKIYRPKKRKVKRKYSTVQTQDLDELLQNGFSQRHINNNRGSVITLDELYDSTTIGSHMIGPSMASTTGLTNIKDASTDFKLLGICNQLEMLLNKQLLHPVLSLKGHNKGKSFSDKNIVPVADGLWRLSDDKNGQSLGIVLSRTESFTVTPSGGEFESTVDPKVSISFPAKAVVTTLHARLKIVKMEQGMLQNLTAEDEILGNILSIGPIVFFKVNTDAEFNQQVVVTIPPALTPSGGQTGHLNIISVKDDNSCIPSSGGYQLKNGYISISTWQLSGKCAVLTRAKCKYKACKSMESLLNYVLQSTMS